MTRKKSPPRASLLEQIVHGLRAGGIPLALAVELDAPGALDRAWHEQPFTDIPFSERPDGTRVTATRSRGASIFTNSTDFDGPNIFAEILMHTRPRALFAMLHRLREDLGMHSSGSQEELDNARVLLDSGNPHAATHWATQLTRSMVSRLCGFQGNEPAPGPCSDAPIVNALRACGPPSIAEIVAAAARNAEFRERFV